jgi:chromosome partitioning protein
VIISILNTKGGVAKTTTAILLGCALSDTGPVAVLDADPQGSASMWAHDADAAGQPLGITVLPANVTTLKASPGRPEDFILIDTPPGDSPTINAAMRVSDLVIIPTGTSALDMQRMWETYEAVRGVPRMILITQAEPWTRLCREALAAIDTENDVLRFDTLVPKSQAIRRAMGTRPADLGAYRGVAQELLEVAR